jgi:BirA family biotin operon repressor/biotin-[acetyl-CoA-carboxylase] ligase
MTHPPLLEHQQTVDSTNHELKRRWLAGNKQPTAIWSNTQTAGRGRLARQWLSPEGGLYYSALTPTGDLPPTTLGFVAGVAVHQLLQPLAPSISLKWPNDILATPPDATKEHKLGGILSELLATPHQPHHAIIGIGLNINTSIQLPPEGTHIPPTSLRAVTNTHHPVDELATALHETLFGLLHTLQSQTQPLESRIQMLRERWTASTSTIGTDVEIHRQGHTKKGHVIGMTKEFALRMVTQEGEIEEIHAGDCIHARPQST